MPTYTRARVATVCQNKRLHNTVDGNREAVMALLDLALGVKPDVVCLPEAFASTSVSQPIDHKAEPVPGPTTDACARRAREHRCYVVCPILTRRDDRTYNSAVILDRTGNVAGVYDKIQPVTTTPDYTKFESGMTPGANDAPVFDLDFGRVAVQICFDAGFPEHWDALARKGARLVFWPSAYNGGTSLRVHAVRNRYYVVSSVRTNTARVIDPLGRVLSETNGVTNVAWRDVNLDFTVCHYDFNYAVPDRIMARYGSRVDVRTDFDDATFMVEPTDPSITTAALREEFGFESAAEYFQRHRVALEAIRRGQTPEPQQAAHGARPMYAKG
jgi:predicted amidohydrolase